MNSKPDISTRRKTLYVISSLSYSVMVLSSGTVAYFTLANHINPEVFVLDTRMKLSLLFAAGHATCLATQILLFYVN